VELSTKGVANQFIPKACPHSAILTAWTSFVRSSSLAVPMSDEPLRTGLLVFAT